MKNKPFLQWIHDRMLHVHGENPNLDYMHKLRAIIKDTPEDGDSHNVCSRIPVPLIEINEMCPCGVEVQVTPDGKTPCPECQHLILPCSVCEYHHAGCDWDKDHGCKVFPK